MKTKLVSIKQSSNWNDESSVDNEESSEEDDGDASGSEGTQESDEEDDNGDASGSEGTQESYEEDDNGDGSEEEEVISVKAKPSQTNNKYCFRCAKFFHRDAFSDAQLRNRNDYSRYCLRHSRGAETQLFTPTVNQNTYIDDNWSESESEAKSEADTVILEDDDFVLLQHAEQQRKRKGCKPFGVSRENFDAYEKVIKHSEVLYHHTVAVNKRLRSA